MSLQDLRARAEALGHALPPLLAEAERLAQAVVWGEHGRRRAGRGDDFWQYRAAHAGDEYRSIDWRHSARSDGAYVREKEWQSAQRVTLWVDPGASMSFAGQGRAPKSDRARLLALALAVLLLRGGEQVGLAGAERPRAGKGQMLRLIERLSLDLSDADYGAPLPGSFSAQGRAVFLSDFLGDLAPLQAALSEASAQGVRGLLVQVLDPAEEDFPFSGRTVFTSMGGSLTHETQSAGDLRDRYLARLAERKARLADLARAAGWQFLSHHTGDAAQSALLWAYRGLEGR
ncbi:DUF58 domain-containing protein [Stagnihabitans tardus]|uniref:DUF58 domain-containing protein n=1 Tax=Stagnihabitans tardus TaxID=2699202 RepID=A0AAE5BUC8_9RHOB|nr:DUF58 domain-containing protein [Stagnihabitans tardus]